MVGDVVGVGLTDTSRHQARTFAAESDSTMLATRSTPALKPDTTLTSFFSFPELILAGVELLVARAR